MSADHECDPHGIVPDAFLDQYDTDDPAEALRRAVETTSTTDTDAMQRCRSCESVNITKKAPSVASSPSHRRDEDWKCRNCGAHFDTPLSPVADEIGEQATLEGW